MIDNIEIIKHLLHFPKPGDSFYFVQVLQRKKDHPGMKVGGSNNNSRLIKAYQVESLQYLDTHYNEMKELANLFNARVGINLNPRSYEKTAFQLLTKMANQMENRNFRDVRKAYDAVCGNYHAEMDKRWLIDIDTKDEHYLNKVGVFIKLLQSEIHNREYNALATLPTKSGYHIITNPFNLERFSKEFPEIEVHKNNPTLLYCP